MSDTWPKISTLFLHADKESNYDHALWKLGLTGEAAKEFAHAGYEIAVTILVHEDGSVFATHLDTLPLSAPTRI